MGNPWNFKHFMHSQPVFYKWQNICPNRWENSPILLCCPSVLTVDLTMWLALANGSAANRMETEIWKVLAHRGLPSLAALETSRSQCGWTQVGLLEDERPCGRELNLPNQQSTTLVVNLPDEQWEYARPSGNQLTHQLTANAWMSSSETSRARLDQKESKTDLQNHEQNNIVVILKKWNLGVVCYPSKVNWYPSQSGLKENFYTCVVKHDTMGLPLLTTVDGTMGWSIRHQQWGGPGREIYLRVLLRIGCWLANPFSWFLSWRYERKTSERDTDKQ